MWDVVPMISHSDSDPGRTLGAGDRRARQALLGRSHIGYNRMNFRGPDYSSFQISPGSHMDQVATHWYRQGPIPVTINIGIPPTCTMMAGSGIHVILPRARRARRGRRAPGLSGRARACPDAGRLVHRDAEYVLEGYIDTTQKVCESPLAEKDARGVHPFHPDGQDYMGKSYRTYKFQRGDGHHPSRRPAAP